MLNTDLIVIQDAFIGLLHMKRSCCEEVFPCRNQEITEWIRGLKMKNEFYKETSVERFEVTGTIV